MDTALIRNATYDEEAIHKEKEFDDQYLKVGLEVQEFFTEVYAKTEEEEELVQKLLRLDKENTHTSAFAEAYF